MSIKSAGGWTGDAKTDLNMNLKDINNANNAHFDSIVTSGLVAINSLVSSGAVTVLSTVNATGAIGTAGSLIVSGTSTFLNQSDFNLPFNKRINVNQTFVPNQGGVAFNAVPGITGDGNYTGFNVSPTYHSGTGQFNCFASTVTHLGTTGEVCGWRSNLNSAGNNNVMGAYARLIGNPGSAAVYGFYFDFRPSTIANSNGIYLNNELAGTTNMTYGFHVSDNSGWTYPFRYGGGWNIDEFATETRGGGLIANRTTTATSGTYTTTGSDYYVGLTNTSGAIISLGSLTMTEGRVVIVKDEGGNASGTNSIWIIPQAGNIDLLGSISIATQGDSKRIMCGSPNWFTW